MLINIQIKPVLQNFCVVLFISQDFTKRNFGFIGEYYSDY